MSSVGKRYLENIRKRHLLSSDSKVAVKGNFDTKATVDTDNGNRDIVITATSDSIDLVGDVVVQGGIDWTYFAKNRRIFTEHDTSIEKWVASLRYIRPLPAPGEKARRTEIRIRMHETVTASDILTIAKMYGIGASIGFDVLDWGSPTPEETKKYTQDGIAPSRIIRTCRLLETSMVGLPCNIDCITGGESVDQQRSAVLDELVTKGHIRRESAIALGLTDANRKIFSLTERRNIIGSSRRIIVVDI